MCILLTTRRSLWAMVLFIVLLPGICTGASIMANSLTGGLRDNSDATWVLTSPTAADTISWTSGGNQADITLFPQRFHGPEAKFAFPGGVPAGRGFVGFGRTDGPGVCGSTADTGGGGASVSGPVDVGPITWTASAASWTVVATGQLGKKNPCTDAIGQATNPFWSSQSTGNDPFTLSPDQLAFIDEPTFDLFFEAAIVEGGYSRLGSIGLDVSYETAAGTLNLLSILLDPTGATVTGESVPELSMYRLASLFEGPTEIPANLVGMSDIEALLDPQAVRRRISSPLFLGFVLEGIPVPTTDLGDGTVARISVRSHAADAAVPEPASAVLLLVSVLCCSMRYRRVRSSR